MRIVQGYDADGGLGGDFSEERQQQYPNLDFDRGAVQGAPAPVRPHQRDFSPSPRRPVAQHRHREHVQQFDRAPAHPELPFATTWAAFGHTAFVVLEVL